MNLLQALNRVILQGRGNPVIYSCKKGSHGSRFYCLVSHCLMVSLEGTIFCTDNHSNNSSQRVECMPCCGQILHKVEGERESFQVVHQGTRMTVREMHKALKKNSHTLLIMRDIVG